MAKSVPPFSVHDYTHDTLATIMSETSGATLDEVKEKVQLRYFKEYFEGIGAKTVLVERHYVDHDYLEDYAFDGRSITQYRGDEGSAFPGGYTKVLVATMEQAIASRTA